MPTCEQSSRRTWRNSRRWWPLRSTTCAAPKGPSQGAEPVQAVDMAALLASVQADLSETGGRVTLSGRPLGPYAGHPAALKRCVRNLAENAVNYGRVAHIEVRDGEGALELLFRDEGPGLAAQELDRVFEPFYRVDPSRSRETGGTGLGLTIARSIAELHAGTLTLRNHPEGGLEARLVLPRINPETAGAIRPARA
jgi:signal transduction histidine kinase